MRELLQALRNDGAQGGVVGSESFDFGHESANELKAFSGHISPMEIDMEKEFKATLSMVVTKSDGTAFAEFHHTYHNMDLEDVVELEEFSVKALSQMNDWGKQSVIAKKQRANKGG